MMTEGVAIRGVDFSYEARPILAGIDLSIPSGQFLTLLGASGSGKTTLLRLMAGLQAPVRGELHWLGKRIAGPGLERGVVFQDYSLFPWLSVVDNIAIAIGKVRPAESRRQRRALAREYLSKVGLDGAVGKYPFELSGGMRQRAAIARALALGSPLLLMDEPFGAVDPVNRARLQDLLLEIWEAARPKTTIVFVTHDVDEALYLGDRVVMLGSTPGRVIADLPVTFARHRDRSTLFNSEDFRTLRGFIATTLAADMLEQLVAA